MIAAAVVGAVAVVVAAAAVTVVLTHHGSSTPVTRPAAIGPAATDRSGSGSTIAPGKVGGTAERAAASQVASVLADDAMARTAVVAATQAVGGCTGDPTAESVPLQAAVATRQADITRLQGLSADDLPNGSALVGDLVMAMQASDQADSSYEQWMSDVAGTSCPYATSTDANFQAASAASTQATTAKTSFTALWDPLATMLGLTTYTQSQI